MLEPQIASHILDHASIGLGLYDPEGNILYFNRIAYRYMNIQGKTLVGKNIREVFPGPAGEAFMDRINKALQSELAEEYEDTMVLARRERTFLTTYQRIVDQNGVVVGVLLLSDDISVLKKAQSDLAEISSFYQEILETVNDGIWVTDKDDRIIYANHAMAKIAGVGEDQLVGVKLKDFPKETTQHFLPLYERIKASLKQDTYQAQVTTPSGRETIQKGWLIPRIEKKHFAGMICTIQDVTVEVQQRSKIEEISKKAQLYLELVPTIIISLDQKGNVVLINQKGCEILETTLTKIVGQNWFDHFIPAELVQEVKEVFKKIMNDEYTDVEYFENEVITSTGKRRLIQWHNTLLRNDHGEVEGLLSSGLDITDDRRRRNELQTKMKELERFNRLMVGRENQMISLKAEINELCKELNQPPRYTIPGIGDQDG